MAGVYKEQQGGNIAGAKQKRKRIAGDDCENIKGGKQVI